KAEFLASGWVSFAGGPARRFPGAALLDRDRDFCRPEHDGSHGFVLDLYRAERGRVSAGVDLGRPGGSGYVAAWRCARGAAEVAAPRGVAAAQSRTIAAVAARNHAHGFG